MDEKGGARLYVALRVSARRCSRGANRRGSEGSRGLGAPTSALGFSPGKRYASRMSLEQDTSEGARTRYFDLLAKAGLEGRARILASLCGGVRTLAEAGIRQADPCLSDDQVRAALTERLYGREVALRLHGDVVRKAEATPEPE